MDISSLENWLSNIIDNKSQNKFKRFVLVKCLAPIVFVLEYFCWFKIWMKIVLPALIESEGIFEFLNTNEFAYRKWFRLSKFEKMDIIPESNQFYAEIKDTEKLRQEVRKEYINTFLDILDKHSPFDLQNYISLQCKINYQTIDSRPIRIYTVSIQYWRHAAIIKAFENVIIWIIGCVIGYVSFWYLINTINTQFIG